MTALLSTANLNVGYGSLAVGRNINMEVKPGEVTCVLGPNGAGKTTLLLTLAGFLDPLGGELSVNGVVQKKANAQKMNESGVVLIPDNRALFTQLNPVENLKLAYRKGGRTVDEVLDLFPALRERSRVKAGMLSGGEQQMLAMGRGIVQGPKVLLIDEMSMGLAPVIVEQLVPLVRQVADQTGAGVVLVEQHVRLALEVADSAVVIVHGDVVLQESAAALKANPKRMEDAYLGAAHG